MTSTEEITGASPMTNKQEPTSRILYELMLAIEKLPASEDQTNAMLIAERLRKDLAVLEEGFATVKKLHIHAIKTIAESRPTPQADEGPDVEDGHDWEGFTGGCKRFNCPPDCNKPTPLDEVKRLEEDARRYRYLCQLNSRGVRTIPSVWLHAETNGEADTNLDKWIDLNPTPDTHNWPLSHKEEAECKHEKTKCVYESSDGEFERHECLSCGKRVGVEIPQ